MPPVAPSEYLRSHFINLFKVNFLVIMPCRPRPPRWIGKRQTCALLGIPTYQFGITPKEALHQA